MRARLSVFCLAGTLSVRAHLILTQTFEKQTGSGGVGFGRSIQLANDEYSDNTSDQPCPRIEDLDEIPSEIQLAPDEIGIALPCSTGEILHPQSHALQEKEGFDSHLIIEWPVQFEETVQSDNDLFSQNSERLSDFGDVAATESKTYPSSEGTKSSNTRTTGKQYIEQISESSFREGSSSIKYQTLIPQWTARAPSERRGAKKSPSLTSRGEYSSIDSSDEYKKSSQIFRSSSSSSSTDSQCRDCPSPSGKAHSNKSLFSQPNGKSPGQGSKNRHEKIQLPPASHIVDKRNPERLLVDISSISHPNSKTMEKQTDPRDRGRSTETLWKTIQPYCTVASVGAACTGAGMMIGGLTTGAKSFHSPITIAGFVLAQTGTVAEGAILLRKCCESRRNVTKRQQTVKVRSLDHTDAHIVAAPFQENARLKREHSKDALVARTSDASFRTANPGSPQPAGDIEMGVGVEIQNGQMQHSQENNGKEVDNHKTPEETTNNGQQYVADKGLESSGNTCKKIVACLSRYGTKLQEMPRADLIRRICTCSGIVGTVAAGCVTFASYIEQNKEVALVGTCMTFGTGVGTAVCGFWDHLQKCFCDPDRAKASDNPVKNLRKRDLEPRQRKSIGTKRSGTLSASTLIHPQYPGKKPQSTPQAETIAKALGLCGKQAPALLKPTASKSPLDLPWSKTALGSGRSRYKIPSSPGPGVFRPPKLSSSKDYSYKAPLRKQLLTPSLHTFRPPIL